MLNYQRVFSLGVPSFIPQQRRLLLCTFFSFSIAEAGRKLDSTEHHHIHHPMRNMVMYGNSMGNMVIYGNDVGNLW